MRKFSLLLIILALIVAACANQPVAQEATEETPSAIAEETQAEPPLEALEAPVEVPASETPEETEPPGSAIYKIVPGESQLQYEVGEVFLNQNNRFNVAIGVTTQISGDISVDLQNPQNSSLGPITADISQFKSDSVRRDNALRDRFLQTNRFPIVTFIGKEVNGLPNSYQAGQEIQLIILGDLTIRETTRPVEFQTTIILEGETLSGTATTTILMSDFGFGPIDLAGILKTEDEAVVTLNFVARS